MDTSIMTAIDALRGRLRRLKGKRGMDIIAPECGAHVQVLREFLNGKSVTTSTLLKIETWCDQEESRRANTSDAE